MFKEVPVSLLKPHPKNSYFFDDIEGEKWEEFLASISRNGVMTPLLITNDNVIVSGHQRAKACVALGINTVKCLVFDFKNEDDEIISLIDSNIRQRGIVNSPSVKLGRIILEQERILKADARRSAGEDGAEVVSKAEVAERLGIDGNVASRAKSLAKMPNDVQQVVEDGIISVRTALDVVSKLKPDEQVELVKSLDAAQKYTQKEVQNAIKAHFPMAEHVQELEAKLAEYQNQAGETEVDLRKKLADATQRERTTYETFISERRAHKNAINEYERRLEKTEELISAAQSEIPDDYDATKERLSRYESERDDLIHDAEVARNDADLILICAMLESVANGLSEPACDPTPLHGDLIRRAEDLLNKVDNVLDKIRARILSSSTAA